MLDIVIVVLVVLFLWWLKDMFGCVLSLLVKDVEMIFGGLKFYCKCMCEVYVECIEMFVCDCGFLVGVLLNGGYCCMFYGCVGVSEC